MPRTSRLLVVGLCGVGLASLLGCVGHFWWFFDLMSHFRAQYACLFALALVGLAIAKKWRLATACVLGTGFNLYFVLPLYIAAPPALQGKTTQGQTTELDIIVFNVRYDNEELHKIVDYLTSYKSDLLVLVEATPSLRDALVSALPRFHVVEHARQDAFGMLLLSRHPVGTHEVLYLAGEDLPSIAATIEKDGCVFSVLGVHTMPPIGRENAQLRDRMLHAAGSWAKTATNSIVGTCEW